MAVRRACWWAFGCSFLVYLLPLVGPHGSFTFGLALTGELADLGGQRPPLWLAADVGLAVALQAAAWALFYWFFRKPGWRAVALLAAVPVMAVSLSWLYLVLIPKQFLIETDRSPEQGDWSVECAVPDAWIEPVRSPADLALERAAEALLLQSNIASRLRLRMPGCRQAAVDFSGPNPGGFYVAPGGKMLYYTMEPGSGALRWWFREGAAEPQSVEEPKNAFKFGGQPVLSRDGAWVAWIIRNPQTPGTPPQLLLRRRTGIEERRVSLEAASPARFTLLDVDTEAGRVLAARNEEELVEVGFDGAVRPIPLELGGVKPLANTMRRLGDGWVAWDGYKENESYHVAWSLPGGTGTHRVPNGRSIQSVAVHPEGRYVAVSIGTALSIGDFGDAVYVLRASDGVTVWRRNLPRYARSQVTFLGSEWFAYTHWDGVSSEMRVLRIPGS